MMTSARACVFYGGDFADVVGNFWPSLLMVYIRVLALQVARPRLASQKEEEEEEDDDDDEEERWESKSGSQEACYCYYYCCCCCCCLALADNRCKMQSRTRLTGLPLRVERPLGELAVELLLSCSSCPLMKTLCVCVAGLS